MTLREQTQRREDSLLSPFACRSAQSRGRARQEKECDIRTPFQRDIDRIVYSKAFRRLKHKTQVFLQPEGDHYRTRKMCIRDRYLPSPLSVSLISSPFLSVTVSSSSS